MNTMRKCVGGMHLTAVHFSVLPALDGVAADTRALPGRSSTIPENSPCFPFRMQVGEWHIHPKGSEDAFAVQRAIWGPGG